MTSEPNPSKRECRGHISIRISFTYDASHYGSNEVVVAVSNTYSLVDAPNFNTSPFFN